VVTELPAKWLLLVYTVPREPSANRVSVWRKLKRLGAILLHDAVWVLPNTPRTAEQLQWLASDIGDLGGEAQLWQSGLCQPDQDEALVQRFQSMVDGLYAEIEVALANPRPDLALLSRRYQQARLQDYFHSPLGECVRRALLAAGGRTDR
jgi:ChrB-like protein